MWAPFHFLFPGWVGVGVLLGGNTVGGAGGTDGTGVDGGNGGGTGGARGEFPGDWGEVVVRGGSLQGPRSVDSVTQA